MQKLYSSLIVIGGVTIFSFAGLRIVFAQYRIPSASMIPTFTPGSYAWANRFSRSPERGDVIAFAYPENPEQDFMKRVIAVGGDTLEVRAGHPFINGWEVPSCRVGAYSYEDEESIPPKHEGTLFVEYLGAHSYFIFVDSSRDPPLATGPFKALPGDSWVLGDNRLNSHDSPMWFGGVGGGVPSKLLRGRVVGGDRVTLPKNASPSLQPALDDCLRKRPTKTTP